MKEKTGKRILLIALSCIFAGTAAACTKAPGPAQEEPPVQYEVTFDMGGGRVLSKTVSEGSPVEEPEEPFRCGFTFEGWYSDGVLWDFAQNTVSQDLTLTADYRAEYSAFPAMIIDTEGGAAVTSKEEYFKCSVSVRNTQEKFLFEAEGAKIRGRGNSTWGMPKKPYKLKFNSKTDLFGNGKSKTWMLIANYSDPSGIRNELAYTVGALFDSLDSTTTTQYVDLYFNGSYEGVYLICEQVEAGKNRVDIGEELGDVDMGYLIELDSRIPGEGEEGKDYFTIGSQHYAVKSPDTDAEEYTADYLQFIKSYFESCYAALDGGDWEAVTELIDIPSFAESYVVNEIFKTIDVGQTSFFLHKKAGGKLYCGPIWDYDTSTGNCFYAQNYVPESLYAAGNVWYQKLLQYGQFKEIVRRTVEENKDRILSAVDTRIGELLLLEDCFARNYCRWDTIGAEIWPNTPEMIAIKTWQGQVEYVKDWIHRSLEYLYGYYCCTEESLR